MNGLLENIEERGLKDPWSAITHFIGMLMAMLAAVPLLIKAAKAPDRIHFAALGIFALSMILLYGASATYHSIRICRLRWHIYRKTLSEFLEQHYKIENQRGNQRWKNG